MRQNKGWPYKAYTYKYLLPSQNNLEYLQKPVSKKGNQNDFEKVCYQLE